VKKASEYEKAVVTKSLEIPSRWAPEMIIQTPHKPLECTKDMYNAKIKSERVSPKVPPTTCIGRRVKGRRSEGVEWIITK
jgi:hypothetical protein